MSDRDDRLACFELAIRATGGVGGSATVEVAKAIKAYLDGTDGKPPWKFPYGKFRWFINGKQIMADVFTMRDTGPGATGTLDLSTFLDAHGRPGKTDGGWTFSTSTPAIVTVTQTGELTFDVLPVAGGPTDDQGAFTVTASADTDLGSGTRSYMLTGSGVVVSDQGGVVGGSISFVEKPAA